MTSKIRFGSRAQTDETSVGSGKFGWLKHVALLLFVLLAPLLSMPQPFTTSTYHADARLEADGNWRTVTLWARYTEGRAIFTQKQGATLTLPFSKKRIVHSVEMRLHNYRGEGLNTLAVRIGEQVTPFSYGSAKQPGTSVHTLEFDPPLTGTALEIKTISVQDEAVLIDGLRLVDATPRFDLSRYVLHLFVWALLAVSFTLAVRYAQGPTVTSGRVYANVDMLRGIGAFLVIALHATGYAGGLDLSAIPFVAQFAQQGHYGVEIFYVVSAFTLVFSLTAVLRSGKHKGLVQGFWLRRILRIAPLFGTVFAICIVVGFLFPLPTNLITQETLPQVLWNYVTMTYVFERAVLVAPISHSVWWSISTEFQFYILMPLTIAPLLFVLLKRSWTQKTVPALALAVGMAVAGITLAAGARYGLRDQSWGVYTALYHLDAFLIGVAVALPFALAPHSFARPASSASSPFMFAWVGGAIATFIALLVGVAFSKQIGAALALPSVFLSSRLSVIVMCALAILLLRLAEDNGAFHVLKLRMLRALGLLSFGIYVVHVPVMQLVGSLPVPPSVGSFSELYFWMLGLSLAGSLLLASTLHVFIEMPALAWSKSAHSAALLPKLSVAYVVVVMLSFAWILSGL